MKIDVAKTNEAEARDELIEETFSCASCRCLVSSSKEKFEEHLEKKHKIPKNVVATATVLAHADAKNTYTFMFSGAATHDGRTVRFNIRRTYRRAKPI